MLLFHGTKARFDAFDLNYTQTGEGVNHGTRAGFHFTESLRGACRHAENYLRCIDGLPLVYVCELPESVHLLDRGRAISESGEHVTRKWRSTDIANQIEVDSVPWFVNLQNLLQEVYQAPVDDDAVYRWLGENGFPAICGIEFASDPHFEGSVILVIRPDKLSILERYETSTLTTELRAWPPRRYTLAATREPLGDTGPMSFLRERP